MTTVRQLYDLQELDWEIDRFRANLASVEERIQDDSALSQARSEAEERDANLLQLRTQHGVREMELRGLEERAKALAEKLYGGMVKGLRELESLESELRYAKEQVGGVEEEVLSLMIHLDEQEELAAKSKLGLSLMEKEREKSLADLGQEKRALLGQLAGLTSRRGELVGRTNPGHLARYERLRQTRQGSAMAKVERGMCQGCRLALTTQELQKVRTAQEPVHCSSCGRILYAS